jgi:hypothetical protein
MSSGKFVAFFVILGALLVVDLVQAKLKPLNPEQRKSKNEIIKVTQNNNKKILKKTKIVYIY